MDYGSGELRYKAHMYFEGLAISKAIIDYYINYSVSVSELNHELLSSIIFSDYSENEILNRITNMRQNLADKASV